MPSRRTSVSRGTSSVARPATISPPAAGPCPGLLRQRALQVVAVTVGTRVFRGAGA